MIAGQSPAPPQVNNPIAPTPNSPPNDEEYRKSLTERVPEIRPMTLSEARRIPRQVVANGTRI